MTTARCKTHLRLDCSTCETGAYARRRPTSDDNPIGDPLSPLHQAVYGGAFYGSVDTSPSPSSCDSGSSSGSDSSSYDSGSSSSSYDSGSSSSSYDNGC